MNVSDYVWHRLGEWGLRRLFGYPGDGVGGLDLALERAKDRMQYVQVRHEEMAAFLASAHAKFTGWRPWSWWKIGFGLVGSGGRRSRRQGLLNSATTKMRWPSDRLAKVELRGSIPNHEDPMTEDRLPLAELLAKAGDGDSCAASPNPWCSC